MVYEPNLPKMHPKILLSSCLLLIVSLFSSTYLANAAPDFEQKTLARVDAALDELVAACSQDTTSFREVCTDKIEEAWWSECAVYYDKLDTCKNGKVENYLKGEGRPT